MLYYQYNILHVTSVYDIHILFMYAGALPRIIDNSKHTFMLRDEENCTCLYASFKMNFMVVYTNGEAKVDKTISSMILGENILGFGLTVDGDLLHD